MDRYPLVSALSRPVIVKHLVAAARRHGATVVATGAPARATTRSASRSASPHWHPDLTCIAPVRDLALTRDKAIDYAEKHDLPIETTKNNPYSIDQNVWGRAVETGFLEDIWNGPDRGHLRLHRRPGRRRATPTRSSSPSRPASRSPSTAGPSRMLQAIQRAQRAAPGTGHRPARHGRGPLVGIKSREVYEAPGAIALITAHQELENVTVERELGPVQAWRGAALGRAGLRRPVVQPAQALAGRVRRRRQAHVSGDIRMTLHGGRAVVTGRRSRGAACTTSTSRPTTPATRSTSPLAKGFIESCLSEDAAGKTCGGSEPGRAGRGVSRCRHAGTAACGADGSPAAAPDALAALSQSTHFDWRLAPYDIAGSRAHARVLHRAGLLDDAELAAMLDRRWARSRPTCASGAFGPTPDDEDVHTALERGPDRTRGRRPRRQAARRPLAQRPGGHAVPDVPARPRPRRGGPGRSTSSTRWPAQADRHLGVAMPGRTHLQHAQPVLLAHHLLAHAWALLRDVERLRDWDARAAVSPYGSGALAGSSLRPGPRVRSPRDLGFAARRRELDRRHGSTATSSPSSRSSRPWSPSTCRGSPRRSCSGRPRSSPSSPSTTPTPRGRRIMPQKKNPDVAELARGKAGRLVGDLAGLLTTLKGLPLAYNRDLQEDKEPVFDAVDTLEVLLPAFAGMVAHAAVPHRAAGGAGAAGLLAGHRRRRVAGPQRRAVPRRARGRRRLRAACARRAASSCGTSPTTTSPHLAAPHAGGARGAHRRAVAGVALGAGRDGAGTGRASSSTPYARPWRRGAHVGGTAEQ